MDGMVSCTANALRPRAEASVDLAAIRHNTGCDGH
jgi:hypothetical protein